MHAVAETKLLHQQDGGKYSYVQSIGADSGRGLESAECGANAAYRYDRVRLNEGLMIGRYGRN